MLKALVPSPDHEEAFLQRYDRLRSLALHLVENDPQAAGDLLHDVFLQFSISHPNLATIQNLDGYLYRMLRNMHLSQLRRSSKRPEIVCPVLEFESAITGLETLKRQAEIQAEDDLRHICEYALLRKHTSKAASVLILRFFHAYYPAEIAQVLHKNRNFIDRALRVARVEAKAYLADPDSLAFMSKNRKPEGLKTAKREQDDVLLEIRNSIFSASANNCPPDLEFCFKSPESDGPDCQTLAHVVSCEVCLDRVNEILGLPLLSTRNPEKNLRRDARPQKKSKGGGQPPAAGSGSGGGEMDEFVSNHRRRLKEVLEHHPEELRIAVNGFIVGAHTVNSELSKQSVAVDLEERISFVEIFSDLDLRLLFCSVDPPPEGPGTCRERVELSNGRVLEVRLDFADNRPQVDVTYLDPAFDVISGRQSSKTESTQAEVDKQSKEPERLRKFKRNLSSFARSVRAGLLSGGLWLRPGIVTAVLTVFLIAALLILYRHAPSPSIAAADVLQQASLAEATLIASKDQVLHRTIALEERRASGELISQRQVEVWQSADRAITARRLYDQKGLLVAGDWRRGDGVQTIYHHGSKPQLQLLPEKRGVTSSTVTFDNAWQLSPSAQEFASLVAKDEAVRIEDRGTSFVVTYDKQTREADALGLIKATLTLTKTDLHAIDQTVVIAQGAEQREYHYLETSFERRPVSAVAPAVFEPEPILTGDTATRRYGDSEIIAPSTRIPVTPSPVVPTAAQEIEVLQLLSSVGADLGDEVSVHRTAEGRLVIQGVVDTERRKSEILQALRSVNNDGAIKVDLLTTAEASRREAQAASRSNGVVVQQSDPVESKLPVQSDLERYFSGRGLSEEQLNAEVLRFADRTLGHSRQMLLRAGALKRLAGRFSQEELRTLDQESRSKWLSLIRTHALAVQRDNALLRQELSAVFPSNGVSDNAGLIVLTDDAAIFRASDRLFNLCAQTDRSISAAFVLSSRGGEGAMVKSPEFWRALANIEQQAAELARKSK